MPSSRFLHSLVRPSVAGRAVAIAAAASLVVALSARAGDSDWPRQFDSPSGSFVIYQPQPEDLKGDVLTGRAAFSLKKSDDAPRTFGVLWYTEQIEIDRDSSTVSVQGLDVTKVRLPGITPDEASRYQAELVDEAAGWNLSGSLEELRASLAAAEKERASVAGLDNTPPKILFETRRAILLVYDGAPTLKPIDGSSLQRVANTPFAVVFDPQNRNYYLNGANLWYRARDPLGPWTNVADPPAAVGEIVPPDTSALDQVAGPPPEILTATEPTELIVTNGPPRYASLVDDELLYVTNTESDIVLEIGTQYLYVLLSGRWFRAPSLDGPWTFVRGDELPESFTKVPLDSPKGHILASVAGTEQADDAVADAGIPQTSAIRRDDRSFEATYDGDPEFEPIEGTDLEYAVNTEADVIFADGLYYACDQGVWYISNDPEGPWSVSDTRPLGVEDIPASCPVYDVRYVYIYDSTPDVVYVGYLPGYVGCYPYFGTVVYGTGYRYGSWRGRYHYYPRRFTWGFYARYNLWLSRWSFGFSYGSGFLRVGTRWRSDPPVPRSSARSKWFGPGGYRRPLVAPDMTLLRTRRSERVRTRVSDGLPMNMYNRTENVARVDRTADRIRSRSIARSISRPASSPDDVFAGKDGKVYRRDPGGSWEVRAGTKWKPTSLPTPAPATPGPARRERMRRPPNPPPQPEANARPEASRQPKEPAVERPMPLADRPAPPREQPTPGNLEREYRARERSDRGDSSEQTKPRTETPEKGKAKEKEIERERPPRPSRGNDKRGGAR